MALYVATSLHMLNVANVMSSSIDTISEGTYVVIRTFITKLAFVGQLMVLIELETTSRN